MGWRELILFDLTIGFTSVESSDVMLNSELQLSCWFPSSFKILNLPNTQTTAPVVLEFYCFEKNQYQVKNKWLSWFYFFKHPGQRCRAKHCGLLFGSSHRPEGLRNWTEDVSRYRGLHNVCNKHPSYSIFIYICMQQFVIWEKLHILRFYLILYTCWFYHVEKIAVSTHSPVISGHQNVWDTAISCKQK